MPPGLGRVLWRDAHIKPEDVDLLQPYDGFSGFIYYFLEAYGFCGPGERSSSFRADGSPEAASLPVNPNGGSLGMGRTHGGAQVIEACVSCRDDAPSARCPMRSRRRGLGRQPWEQPWCAWR